MILGISNTDRITTATDMSTYSILTHQHAANRRVNIQQTDVSTYNKQTCQHTTNRRVNIQQTNSNQGRDGHKHTFRAWLSSVSPR